MQKVDLRKRFLKEFLALPTAERRRDLLIAVSAGKDSSVLASVALQLRDQLPPLHFIHVNYHFRIPDSDREEEFLKSWAKREGISFHGLSLHPKSLPSNLQSWAREKRLQYFSKVSASLPRGALVVLAHHEQDQFETLLERWIRGTGFSGMGGMEKLEAFHHVSGKDLQKPLLLFRPFLEVSREAIDLYAKTKKVAYLQDQSNFTKKYFRNRVRLEALPWLKKENPQIVPALCRFGRKLRSVDADLRESAEKWARRHLSSPSLRLPMKPFRKLPRYVQELVLEAWIRQTTNLSLLRSSLDNLLERAQSTEDSGTFALKLRWELAMERDFWQLQKRARHRLFKK